MYAFMNKQVVHQKRLPHPIISDIKKTALIYIMPDTVSRAKGPSSIITNRGSNRGLSRMITISLHPIFGKYTLFVTLPLQILETQTLRSDLTIQ